MRGKITMAEISDRRLRNMYISLTMLCKYQHEQMSLFGGQNIRTVEVSLNIFYQSAHHFYFVKILFCQNKLIDNILVVISCGMKLYMHYLI